MMDGVELVIGVDVLVDVLDELDDVETGAAAPAKSCRYAADPIGNCVVIRRCEPSDASYSKYI